MWRKPSRTPMQEKWTQRNNNIGHPGVRASIIERGVLTAQHVSQRGTHVVCFWASRTGELMQAGDIWLVQLQLPKRCSWWKDGGMEASGGERVSWRYLALLWKRRADTRIHAIAGFSLPLASTHNYWSLINHDRGGWSPLFHPGHRFRHCPQQPAKGVFTSISLIVSPDGAMDDPVLASWTVDFCTSCSMHAWLPK